MSADVLASGGSAAAPAPVAAPMSAPQGGNGEASGLNTNPWFSELISGTDGSLNHKAWDRAPDHLKSLSTVASKYKSFDDMMLGVQHLSTLAGKKALEPLPPGASVEAVAERNKVLRTVLGVPEDPKAYGFAKPQDLPDTMWNQQYAEGMAKIMQDNNVPPAAAKALFEADIAQAKNSLAQAQAQEAKFFQDQDAKFKSGLAQIGMNEQQAMGLVERAAGQFGIGKDHPLMRNGDFRLFAAQVGQQMGEDKLIAGEGSAGDLQSSDLDKALSIVKDKSNPLYAAYKDSGNSDHKRVVALVNSYYEAHHRKTSARK